MFISILSGNLMVSVSDDMTLQPPNSKCGPWNSNMGKSWEHVRNAASGPRPDRLTHTAGLGQNEWCAWGTCLRCKNSVIEINTILEEGPRWQHSRTLSLTPPRIHQIYTYREMPTERHWGPNSFCIANQRARPQGEGWGTMSILQELRELSRTRGTCEHHCLHCPCTWIAGRCSIQVCWPAGLL